MKKLNQGRSLERDDCLELIKKLLISSDRQSEPAFEGGRECMLMIGKKIVFRSRILDLSSKPSTHRLLRCLIEAKGRVVTRFELIEAVYQVDLSKASDRLLESYTTNIVKLISRCRYLLHESFGVDSRGNMENGGEGIGEWLTYHYDLGGWSLFDNNDQNVELPMLA